jgi:DNA-binding GntR family transcriptional regulator
MTTEDVNRLEEAEREVQAAAKVVDVITMTQANRRFHFALIEACGLPRLVRIIRLLWDATEVYRSVYFTGPQNREVVEAEYRNLVAAVKAGDVEQALDILDAHRQHAIAALRPVLEAVAPSQDGAEDGVSAGPARDKLSPTPEEFSFS